MPKFTVECDSKHPPLETYGKVKSFLDNDPDLKKLDPAFKVQFNDSQMSGSAKGSKFGAEIKVAGQGSGAKVQIDVDLAFLLTPVKGMVQSSIEKKLASALA